MIKYTVFEQNNKEQNFLRFLMIAGKRDDRRLSGIYDAGRFTEYAGWLRDKRGGAVDTERDL